jgi:hypothetical protein
MCTLTKSTGQIPQTDTAAGIPIHVSDLSNILLKAIVGPELLNWTPPPSPCSASVAIPPLPASVSVSKSNVAAAATDIRSGRSERIVDGLLTGAKPGHHQHQDRWTPVTIPGFTFEYMQ